MLCITAKNCSVKKFGKPVDEIDHLKVYCYIKRVLTKENTPIVP